MQDEKFWRKLTYWVKKEKGKEELSSPIPQILYQFFPDPQKINHLFQRTNKSKSYILKCPYPINIQKRSFCP